MEFLKKQAIYLQIADHVCEQVLLNKWKANDKIPSVREMAVMLEVNPNTVLRTYLFLESQGVIYKERGLGYYIAEKAKQQTLQLKRKSFFKEELPQFFKATQLLGIQFNEIQQLYQKQRDSL